MSATLGHGVRRLPGGGVRVRLSGRERQVLRDLPAQLRAALADEDVAPAVRERLYSPAYDDPEAEAEYRELVGASVASERIAAVDIFAQTLAEGEEGVLGWSIDLDEEQTAAWLSAVNDARLALAGTVGITSEDEWERGPDRTDPASTLLWYLGWLEEQLVGALAGGLDEPGA